MAFALVIIGAVFLIASVRGTVDTPATGLFALLQSDFTGQNNFIYWMAAILIIGAVGYIPKARPISTALLGLVLAVLFLKNANTTAAGGGFFSQLSAGLASTQAAPATTAAASTTVATGTPSLLQQVQGGLAADTANQNLTGWQQIQNWFPSLAPAAPATTIPTIGAIQSTGTFPPTEPSSTGNITLAPWLNQVTGNVSVQ